MLYVQAAKAQVTGMEATSSATMLRTMENISILLEHLGTRGRESYLSAYPLATMISSNISSLPTINSHGMVPLAPIRTWRAAS